MSTITTATVAAVGSRKSVTRRSALALGSVAVVGGVLAGRAGRAEAATGVELGPATLLQRNPTEAPLAPPPSVRASGYRPSFVRFAYSGNTAASGADRWSWQGLQGDRPKPAGVPNLLVYATAVQRPSDTSGITQCVRPADVRPEWVLVDPAGRPIRRGSGGAGGDLALDVGNAEFQRASAAFLVAKCRREGWSGVLHDEINGEFRWAFADQKSARYPTSSAWQQAQLGYVQYLAAQLAAVGLRLVGNIGEPVYRAWCEDLTRAGMITNTEMFVAGDSGRTGPRSAESGGWSDRVSWLEWSLTNAPAVVVHDRQTNADAVGFGLGTFLLVDNGKGVYGASTGYSASDAWLDSFSEAQRLGSPLGAREQVSRGLWRRDFERGHVLVNSSRSATTYQGGQVGATSGAIVVSR